jgi:hypothetical protein
VKLMSTCCIAVRLYSVWPTEQPLKASAANAGHKNRFLMVIIFMLACRKIPGEDF